MKFQEQAKTAANKQRAEQFVQLHPLLSTIGYLKRHPSFPEVPVAIDGPLPATNSKRKYKTVTQLYEADPLSVAYTLLKDSSYKPVIFVSANANKPGGEFQAGSSDAEADYIIRSTYGVAISKDLRQLINSEADKAYKQPAYPICGTNVNQPITKEFGGLYLPSISVFRNSAEEGYQFHEGDEYNVSVYATSPYPRVAISTGQYSDENILAYAAYTRRKLESLFSAALAKGHDSIVLPFFGDPKDAQITAAATRAVASEFYGMESGSYGVIFIEIDLFLGLWQRFFPLVHTHTHEREHTLTFT